MAAPYSYLERIVRSLIGTDAVYREQMHFSYVHVQEVLVGTGGVKLNISYVAKPGFFYRAEGASMFSARWGQVGFAPGRLAVPMCSITLYHDQGLIERLVVAGETLSGEYGPEHFDAFATVVSDYSSSE